MDDFSKYEIKPVPSTETEDFSQYEIKPEPPKKAPGWLQPGSRSEAVVRGLSQGATLGFGDEIQALVRSLGSDRTYSQLRDEERGANAQAAKANPGSYLAGNIAASVPAYGAATTLLSRGAGAVLGREGTKVGSLLKGTMTTPLASTAAKSGALVGGVAGLGSGEGGLGNQAASTLVGAGLGAAVGGAGAKIGRGLNTAGSAITGQGFRGGALRGATAQAAADAAGGAIIGGTTAKLAGADAGGTTAGAIAGGAVGAKKIGTIGGPLTKLVTKGFTGAAPIIQRGGAQAGRAVSAVNATTLALQNMTGQQARQVTDKASEEIRVAVEKGQPQYAATFQVLQNPAVRAAQAIEEEDLEVGDIE